MPKPYRIIVFDDHPLIHEGLQQLLADQNDFTIQVSVLTSDQLLEALAAPFDLLMLDLNIKGRSSLRLLEHIRLKQPKIKILAFSSYNVRSVVRSALDKGVDGYILKDMTREELLEALTAVMNGERYLSPRIPHWDDFQPATHNAPFRDTFTRLASLTQREQEVARAIVQGLNSEEIGKILFISLHTVQSHRKNLYKKLGVHSAAELVRLAHEQLTDQKTKRKKLPPESGE